MTKYREILRLKSLELSQQSIADSCNVSKKTVNRVLKRAEELGISWPLDESNTDAVLAEKFFPDEEYLLRKIPVSCNPGSVYKNAVKEKSCIHEYINLFHELVNKIGKKVGLPIQKIEEGAFALLAARTHEDLGTEIKHFINQTKLKDQNKKSLEQTIRLFLSRQKYWDEESSYWEDIRKYFKRIAQDNIQ